MEQICQSPPHRLIALLQLGPRQVRQADQGRASSRPFSRVCEVTLLGDHKFTIKQQKYKVSDEIKKGEARDLFGPCRLP